MTRRHLFAAVPMALAIGLGVWAWAWTSPQSISATSLELPTHLTDAEFWRLSETFSEADGYFQSENLVSNEDSFQFVIPELKAVVEPGGVYVGVGPDQNFTYIAALEPKVVFITDVRRGNLLAHLMYKALFELSDNRADFLSRLFSRPRPEGLTAESTARELFEAFSPIRPDQTLREETWQAILNRLVDVRGLTLTANDQAGVKHVFESFYVSGPHLSYSTRTRRGRPYPTYQQLQMAGDLDGVSHGYLANSANYEFIRTMQQKNLIVPIVGNFAGPSALQSVGAWVRDHGARVTTFYTSNVEQYLFQDRIWDDFAANVSRMPMDDTSTFIRSCFNTCASSFNTRSVTLLDSMSGLMKDFADGKVGSYWAVLNHSR